MTIDLPTILPVSTYSLDGVGFFFGAGASYEAGYPLMDSLTKQVVSGLSSGERTLLDVVLDQKGMKYDDIKATPNIEAISDLVIEHSTNSGSIEYKELEDRLRTCILDVILGVESPNLDHHCDFFERLKRRCSGRASTVWIFTTNYDLLFEKAAAKANVTIENGFSGIIDRFFDPARFRSLYGTVVDNRFAPWNDLTVKLIKLHGSVSWIEEGQKYYERHPASLTNTSNLALVLPRKKKGMETLARPYADLFAAVARTLGTGCKYLATCGYSFGDEHINQQLILPALRDNKCKMFTLCKDEPDGIAEFKNYKSFQAGFEGSCYLNGLSTTETTDLWKFSNFVQIF